MPRRRADDGPLVEAFRAGDQAALASLYGRWSPLVYSLALRSLRDVPRAEEATQRVFTEAWAARRSFDPVRARFADWLIGLLRSAVVDAQTTSTSQDRLPAHVVDKPSVAGESKTAGVAELLVTDEVSHLGALSQQVLRMALDDRLSPAQIAEQTRLPVDEVKTHIASALLKLRDRLEVEPDAH